MDSTACLPAQDASPLASPDAQAQPTGPQDERKPPPIQLPRGTPLMGAAAATLAACGGAADDVPATRDEAIRFLEQATFGPSEEDIQRLMTVGYGVWIDEQLDDAANPQVLLRTYWDERDALAKEVDETAGANFHEVLEAFWQNAISGRTQLRDRVAYALSQIFVTSLADGTILENPRLMVGYYDMLSERAFGTYRNLLEGVALHPAMGIYLSHLKNQKEDATGRVPDQNFAREVMQLFSIGLRKLSRDGTPMLDESGNPIDTYGPEDVKGLSRVFTGWSWAGSPKTDGRFLGSQQYQDPDRFVVPMEPYPKYHSVLEKKFLGVTIPAQGTADPVGDMKLALDTLAAHPNVAPFLGRQLIQRLVTSNPSAAYVRRVATAFLVTGGDMYTTIKAVLLDSEARDMTQIGNPTFCKVREPVLRFTYLLRAFNAKSDSGRFLIDRLDDAGSLGQNPLWAPSVFNFYRPGYVPPGTNAAGLDLVMPEMQIANESSVAGYANFIIDGLQNGFGISSAQNAAGINRPDLQFSFTERVTDAVFAAGEERAQADDPVKLAEYVNQKLLHGRMTDKLRADIQTTVGGMTIPSGTGAELARRRRVMTAIAMVAVSPEFIVQK